jgi:Ca-activated chloride channel family protein
MSFEPTTFGRSFGRTLVILFCAAIGLSVFNSARGAGMLVADGGLGGAMEIKQHDVNVVINNGVAVTTVDQVFVNTENRVVEALYTFPVPRGASVASFSMWINDKEMVGEVVEKEKARDIYNSYKRVRRDPGLLEQVDYRTFEMRIFPIPARGEQRVQVVYYQELNVDHDWATYVYPLATRTRSDINARTTGRFSIHVDARSEIPIVKMESPSHAADFAIVARNEHFNEASLEQREGSLSRDVVLAFQCSRPRTGIDVIASKQANEDGYLSLTLTAGEELPKIDAAMDYVFVLDISGSMNNDGKLDLSRRAIQAFVDSLGERDRFEIIAFNVEAVPAFNGLQSANAETKTQAMAFLTGRQARGGTILNPAITTAYKYSAGQPLNVVIFSEQRERAQLSALIGQRPAQTRVFCIGVGNDVNRALLEQLADQSGGLAAFVSAEDSFERQAASFRRKLMRPVATDLKIAIDGVEVYDVEPRQLPNLYHGAPIRLYARYKGAGEATVRVSGTVGGQTIATKTTIELPKSDSSNPEIERMWAWHKVDRLLKEADDSGSRQNVIDEIVSLGESYSIATEYTSFIVLENDAEYKRWKIARKNVSRLDRDRAAQKQVAQQLEDMRRQATDAIGPTLASSEQPAGLSSPTSPTPADARSPQEVSNESPRNRDLNIGGGSKGGGSSGGGAVDPVSGMILAGAAGAALLSIYAGSGEKRDARGMR